MFLFIGLSQKKNLAQNQDKRLENSFHGTMFDVPVDVLNALEERIGVGTHSADPSVVGQSLTLTLKTSNHLCVSEMGRLHVRFPMKIHWRHGCGFVDSSSSTMPAVFFFDEKKLKTITSQQSTVSAPSSRKSGLTTWCPTRTGRREVGPPHLCGTTSDVRLAPPVTQRMHWHKRLPAFVSNGAPT